MSHSRFGPSAASRWLRCPGSVTLSEGIAEESSAFAEEGVKAHDLAERCLRAGIGAHDMPGDFDQDMRDAVQRYLDYCRGLGGDQRLVETRVDFSEWVPEGFGTADYIAIHYKDASIDVVDLKFGKGVQVYAESNPQGMLYAIGAMREVDYLVEVEKVRIHIVQPRLDHIDTWEVSATALTEFGQIASRAAEKALQPEPSFTPGEVQCRFCKAKAICPARHEANLALAREEFGVLPVPSTLSLEQIAAILPRLPDFEAWAKDVRQYAEQQALAGETVPGFKLVEGRSVRQWRDEQAVMRALAEQGLDPDDYTSRKLIGLGAMETLLGGKKAAKPFMDQMTIKPEGKPALVPDFDKRPALEQHSAADDFSHAA